MLTLDHSPAAARYELIKSTDPSRPVTVHGGSAQDQPINEGNDWFLADE